MSFAPCELSQDDFLGGALKILQPRAGFRAGVDPVLLASCIPAKPGQSVLELGCGVGVASLCLGHRVAQLSISGVEIQPDYAELAMRNAALNGQQFAVHKGDLRALPETLRTGQFDHVIANPPYFSRQSGTASPNAGRDLALAGDTPLADWVLVAARRLLPRGYFSVILDIRRLPELLSVVVQHFGSIEVQPIGARFGRAPHLLLLRARKGGRAEFVMHSPIVMHDGAHHDRDGESYCAIIRA
ncbi:MAG: tRNA1(Val) (adenine(37)-N6)-methyltransferase, partial [Halocynthiibacter sp.]